jgi:glucosamine-6-phosphate deaminase
MTSELVVDVMPVRVFPDPVALGDAAAAEAASLIRDAIAARGVANVMFASGNSQLAFLDRLTATPGIEWSRVVGFHMDEYLGIVPTHPASFRRYMHEQILDRVRLQAFREIFGDTEDPEAECDRYAGLLRVSPLDLCCLGIGENGHLAFNDPPVADFDDPYDVKVVDLDDACRDQQVGEGHFAAFEDVPARAITVTIPALLRARGVLAIVPEARKREPVDRALHGPVSADCPASVLRTQPHVTMYLDAASAGDLVAACLDSE